MDRLARDLRRRRLLQVAGGVAVGAIVVTLSVLLLGLGDGGTLVPGTDDAPAADAAADPDDPDDEVDPPVAEAPEEGVEQQLDGGTWRRVAPDEAVFGVGREEPMADVTTGGPGLVAVGYDSQREAAAVWISEDGDTWERVSHDDEVLGGERAQLMRAVTTGGPGLVAVGTDGDAAVWTSEDGRSWQRVDRGQESLGGEDRQDMHAVVEAGPGLVAVGRDRGLGAAAVWVSADGLAWERVEHDEDVFGGDGPQVMTSVAAGGPGVVAVGDDRGTDGDAAVWVSEDGLAWERIEHDEEVFGGGGAQFMTSVTNHGDALVAVGHDFGVGSPAVWVSADGIVWRRTVQDAEDLGGDPGLMNAVAEGGPGLVAVGQDRGVAAVWVSREAEYWQRVPDDRGVFSGDGPLAMRGLTATGAGMVAVGSDEQAGQAAVWIGE
jgi:hypothetical protein